MIRFDALTVTKWGARFQGRVFPVAVGRSGIGTKIGEGDGITPIGTFQILGMGWRTDRWDIDAPNIPQAPIGPQAIWSDDGRDPNYNHAGYDMQYPYGHERLRRADPLYDAFGIMDYNYPDAVAGKGSAIFIHVWRKPRHPTEGCIALDRDDLAHIFANWKPTSRIVIRG
jgi:L,D-peptidoglycan transpeptidase YkuD (ErfK/YbiS/YcfS/YnhG family)